MKPIQFSELELWWMYLVVCKQHIVNRNYVSKNKYTLAHFPPTAVIHSLVSPGQKNKNALVILSGLVRLENINYIQKTVDDIHVESSHDVFVYENKHMLNFLCIDNIVKWIQQEIQPKYDTLTMIGFSNGGVIASHVMYNLENAVGKSDLLLKTLITIDSMNDMFDFLETYEKNKIYRQDIMGCYMTTYTNSFSHSHIHDRIDLLDVFKNTNLETALDYFRRMYDTEREHLRKITTREYKLRNCNIVNIHSHHDPIIQRYHNKKQYKRLMRAIGPDLRPCVKNIAFPGITHCTQMFAEDKCVHFANVLREHLRKA